MTRPNRDDPTTKDLVRTHWDGRAATFDAEPQHGIHSTAQHERWLTVLAEWTGDDPRRVLDVGCGTGVLSMLLAELGHKVVGVDFATEMLEAASSKAEESSHTIAFQRGDAETLAIRDDSVDLLTARHLIWTLPHPVEAVREWQRVVAPGGHVVLIEGHWKHDEPWDEYVRMHDDLPMYDGRPPAELRNELRREGFTDVTHEPLMEATLWGREPRHEYYILSATVPG